MARLTKVEILFWDEVEENPFLSDFINFGRAIKGMNLLERELIAEFDRLVLKSDYSRKDRQKLIDHLKKLNSTRKKPL